VAAAPLEVRVLFIEDSQQDVELTLNALSRSGIRTNWRRAHNAITLREALAEFEPDILISDYTLPGFGGMEALEIARELRPNVPLIFVSGTIGEERAIETLKQGATDYVLKDNLERLVPALKRALIQTKERAAHRAAQRLLATQYAVARVLAEAPTAEESVPRLLQAICEQLGFVIGTLWKVDPGADTLRCMDVWHAASPALAEFAAATRKLKSFPAAGVVRRAWRSGQPMWLSDVMTDPDFVRAPDATKAGLHAVAALPIVLQGRITGVMDFFGTEIREPDRDLLDALGAIGSQIGQIMERLAQQEHIARLNRIYAVLSGTNAAIFRVRDRQELFNETCRIAVEHGRFGIAWIGAFDPETLDVTVVAWAGFKAEELIIAGSKGTARTDVREGQGAVGRAIREKRPVFSNDITAEPEVGGERRREAVRRGYRSLVVLPLIVEGEVAGTLSLFAKEPDFFTQDELKLLTQLAGDISLALESIGKQEQLDYLANYDVLTGAANRNLLIDRLTQTVTQARRYGHVVAVAFLDIDNFKLINDSLGHAAGNELLKIVAGRLRSCVRESDTVARLSADEFVLVLPGQTGAAATSRLMQRITHNLSTDPQLIEMLQRVLKIVSEPMTLEKREYRVTSSIGVSLFPQDGGDAETLLRNADAALSRAKQLGRNNIEFYTAEINARIARRLVLHTALRRALEGEEFELYYQPKITLRTGQISGVEALLRWNSPDAGKVLPAEFIPVLEETGLIVDVGRWVIKTAVLEYARWLTLRPNPPRIAVNVSQLQLAQKDFAEVVEKILKDHAPRPVGLDMEITESFIMQDLDNTVPKLQALKRMGVNVAIDDFGTGYSSLSYLAKLPVSALKIDRAFVAAMEDSADNLAIVTTIISLAKSLGRTIIAEGVETEEQLKMLRLLKCDEIQGYLISHPLSGEQFEEWWRHFALDR